MCLGIVLQGAGHCKSERTVLFKRCTFAMLLFRHCFKRTYAWQGQFMMIDSMLMIRHCQNAARHILIASYGRHRPRVP